MRKWLSLTMMSVLVFSLVACGGPGKDSVSEGSSSEVVEEAPSGEHKEEENTGSVGDGAEEKEELPDPVTEGKARPVPLEIMVGTEYAMEADDEEEYQLLCSAEWSILRLGEESAAAYPQLQAALTERNETDCAYYENFVTEMTPDAREHATVGAFFYTYSSNSESVVVRADDRILSVQENGEEYTGGVHPYYWVSGLNLNPETGETVALTDILTDTTQLPTILTKKIMEEYPEEPWDNLQTQLNEYSLETYSWTLDYQGITFYFSPYEIASYAAGLMSVTIWFDEMPQLFHEKYTGSPENGWIRTLTLHRENEVDLNAVNGEKTCLPLWSIGEEYGYSDLFMAWNGETIQLEECSGFWMTPLLVCTGEGGTERYYLYVERVVENDYASIIVYDLNGTEPTMKGVIPGVGFSGYYDEEVGEYGQYYTIVLNDPSEYTLASMIDILGTWAVTRNYTTSPENGLITAVTEAYTFPDEVRPLISLIELEVSMLPDGTTETLPAGTQFYPVATDAATYMTLKLDDGRMCRIALEQVEYEWRIHGIPEYDCFEDLMYAG